MCSLISLPTLFYHLSLIRAHSEMTMCVIKKERWAIKNPLEYREEFKYIFIYMVEGIVTATETFICMAPLSEITDSHF